MLELGPNPSHQPSKPTQLIGLISAERPRRELYYKYAGASRRFVCGGRGSVSQARLMRTSPSTPLRGVSLPQLHHPKRIVIVSPVSPSFTVTFSKFGLLPPPHPLPCYLLYDSSLGLSTSRSFHSDGLITFFN